MVSSLPSDFALCDTTCKRIVEKHGNGVQATELPEKERVVALVWSVSGVIENGGFRYLFGTPPPGDPCLEYTIRAFETIGCSDAVTVMKEALDLFPNSMPPQDRQLRIMHYDSQPAEIRDGIDSRFWKQLDVITRLLARYIRDDKE